MKKFIAILVGAVLTLGAIALTSSCQKDINNAKSLVGSTWAGVSNSREYNLTFASSTDFDMEVLSLPLTRNIYRGSFIVSGNKDSITGSNIALAFDNTWKEDWSTGYFKSESELVLNSVVFTKVLQK